VRGFVELHLRDQCLGPVVSDHPVQQHRRVTRLGTNDAPAGAGGVWSVPVHGPGSWVDVAAAVRVTDESLYVGKVVHHLGAAYFMAFRNRGPDAAFVGGITDPIPVTWRADGLGLMLASSSAEPVV